MDGSKITQTTKAVEFIRFPLIVTVLLALLAAIWAGWVRLGLGWAPIRPTLPLSHGPLMICGFLGTMIGVERAIALSAWSTPTYRWAYIGPVLTALGALVLIQDGLHPLGPLMMTLGSLALVLVFGLILRLQFALFSVTMALGALLWLIGNSLWLWGQPIYAVVPWWGGFLILTVAGERLELARILQLPPSVKQTFGAIIGWLILGLALTRFGLDLGVRIYGLGAVALAGWLLRYDVARRTVRQSGLTRFMAVCLLSGYGWLAIGGLLATIFGGVSAGYHYDAIQHAFFVGFIISMIFGHAPIIFPAVLRRPIAYRFTFYIHLIVLHFSLFLRVLGDLWPWLLVRQWGGLLNGVALLLFLANTVYALRVADRSPE